MNWIEVLEGLATELEDQREAHRARLARLCRAYVRILAAREPERFQAAACHHGDEAGHSDSSYPPKQQYTDHTGPRLVSIKSRTTEDIATESGFYFAWRRVTTYGGLRVDARGRWWRSEETGTGRVGQFAAHPGDCHVDCAIAWETVSDDDVTLAELVTAETLLRQLAFPLATAVAGAA